MLARSARRDFYNIAVQVVQQQNTVTLIYGNDHQVRFVRMNQPHPEHLVPSCFGDFFRRLLPWHTLVIDTVGMKVGPLSMVDFFGTPFTGALHVVERYRLIDYQAAVAGQERGLNEWSRLPGGAGAPCVTVDPLYKGQGLELHFAVEDDGVFTTPWSAIVTYRRAANAMPENVCAENLRGTFLSKDSAAPLAISPDF